LPALLILGGATGLMFGLIGCETGPPPPSIVLVILDTVRDDCTGVGDRGAGWSPELDRIAAEGTVFRNAWANSPWTVPSHASFFTGRLSSDHDCTHRHPRLDTGWPTLAELLGRAGYRTAAFYSNPWLADRTTGLLRGFGEKIEAPLRGGLPEDPGRYRGDQGGRASVIALQNWLRNREGDEPFFVFVNFLEAHLPYDPPPDFRPTHLAHLPADDMISAEWGLEYQAGLHRWDSVDWGRVQDLYAGDVLSSDRLLAGLVAVLQDQGLYEDTVLIVASDHGENLGDHGLVDHQFSVHETLLAVPLVVRAPGRLPPGDRPEPVMLSDLFATICELAGVEPEGSGAAAAEANPHSISLLSPLPAAGRPLIAEYFEPQAHLIDALAELNPELDPAPLRRTYRTIRLGDLRLTVASDGLVELHDLAADPGQRENLADRRPQDVAALRALLEQQLPATGPRSGEVEMDEATREQLRSLGYIH